MAKQTIDIGAIADDGTGDPLRTAFDKTNDNCDELYTGLFNSSTPGPHVAPVGSVSLPSRTFVGDLNTGWFWDTADQFVATCGGVEVARFGATTALTLTAPASSNVTSLIVQMLSSTAAHTPTARLQKARNNVGVPSALQSGDRIGGLAYSGHDGVVYSTQALIYAVTTEIWVNATDRGCALVFETTPNDSVTRTERMRLNQDGALQMGSTPTTVIDVNRHFQLRSYTVAGVPSAATAGQMIYISNETGGAVPAFSDGTNWRRVTDRAIVA